MLPLLVLRRMDAVLEPTKDEVLEYADGLVEIGPGQDRILKRICGQRFYNTSRYTFARLLSDDKNLADNLAKYIASLSPDAATVIEAYQFDGKITRMDHAGILYGVMADFADLDLRPSEVSNETMGYIFEELLRKFSEMSNETAGEHYTPRESIRLVADLLIGGSDRPRPDRKPDTGAYHLRSFHATLDTNARELRFSRLIGSRGNSVVQQVRGGCG